MRVRTVGLVVAMSAEARSLTGRVQPLEQVVRIAEHAYLRVGGVGASAAERSCAALVEAGASALVSAGCAAGLAPECRPGALVVPAEVRSAQGEVFSADAEWRVALVAAAGLRISPLVGAVVSVDRVIGSVEKSALHASTGAIAADMESAAVAREAQRLGLPMISVRVVSDGMDDEFPNSLLDAIDAFGRPRLRPLVNAIVQNPGDAAVLMRSRTGFKKACSTLSLLAANVGPTFCCPGTTDG
ncbi:MAG TPA: hypothetical protein VLS27_10915 [Gammaproteobacteria bacterium]|nr:hypothetical protein [Gammaproteobacteria bacterium]